MYDLIVIGGGPAGNRGAELAAKAGKNVALIEKGKLGGTCLNEGCIPSKAFLHISKTVEHAKACAKEGMEISGDITINQEQVVINKDRVVKRLGAAVASRVRNAGVEVITGEAFVEGKDGDNFIVKVNDQKYTAKNLLLATGSVPIIPPIEGLKEGLERGFVLTNEGILSLKEIPENLVVVGAGVIGLELGSHFNTAGSKVTVIEMLPDIGGRLDSDVSSTLRRSLEKKGMVFETEGKVTKFGENEVVFERNGETFSVPANKVLVSIGRRPDTRNKGFENIGLDVTRAIKTDSKMRTVITNVYAAGDINGISLFTHTAYREAEVFANTLSGKEDNMDYSAIPFAIFTSPEVGGAGITEADAISQALDVKVVKIPLTYSGRYVVESPDRTGFMKLIYDNKNDTLLGFSVVGSYASEYIGMMSTLIGLKIKVEDIKTQTLPHPTVVEAFRDMLFEI